MFVREIIERLVREELSESIGQRIVSGNVGDPETNKELAAIQQGIVTGNVSEQQLDMLSGILSHNLKHAIGNVDMWVQMAKETGDVDYVHRAISVLQKSEKRLGELVVALGGPQE